MRTGWCSKRPSDALALVSLALVSSLAVVAHAQPSERDVALAETLFREGKELMEAERYQEACPKLAESQRLDPATGTLLALAVCHEAEGKTATAWAEFVDAAALAEQDGRQDRVDYARQRIRALEPKLSRLKIVVPPSARVRGLDVSRNGVSIGEAAWGTDTPVDPGPQRIEARAPGRRSWSTTVRLVASDRQRITVPTLARTPDRPARPPPTKQPEAPPISPLVIAGGVVGGLGVVSIAVGTYFGVRAIDKSDQAKALCTPEFCDNADAVALNDDAKVAANVANVTLALGVAAVAAGIVMIVVGTEEKAELSFEVRPSGIGLRGTF